MPGIGKVTEQVLAGVLGVTTCGDLLAARAYLPALFQPASSTFLLHAGKYQSLLHSFRIYPSCSIPVPDEVLWTKSVCLKPCLSLPLPALAPEQ